MQGEPWIPMRTRLPSDPRVFELSQLFARSLPEPWNDADRCITLALGYLARTWMQFTLSGKVTPEGNLFLPYWSLDHLDRILALESWGAALQRIGWLEVTADPDGLIAPRWARHWPRPESVSQTVDPPSLPPHPPLTPALKIPGIPGGNSSTREVDSCNPPSSTHSRARARASQSEGTGAPQPKDSPRKSPPAAKPPPPRRSRGELVGLFHDELSTFGRSREEVARFVELYERWLDYRVEIKKGLYAVSTVRLQAREWGMYGPERFEAAITEAMARGWTSFFLRQPQARPQGQRPSAEQLLEKLGRAARPNPPANGHQGPPQRADAPRPTHGPQPPAERAQGRTGGSS